jgi:hypothetical protein
MDITMSKFPDWITKAFLEWQTQQGKRKTLEEFAAFIGVSRPLVNMWMKSAHPSRPSLGQSERN